MFFRAKKSEAEVMNRILDRYAKISGQLIIYNKFVVTFSPNTKADNRVEVCTRLEVKESTSLGKYLGMPM